MPLSQFQAVEASSTPRETVHPLNALSLSVSEKKKKKKHCLVLYKLMLAGYLRLSVFKVAI